MMEDSEEYKKIRAEYEAKEKYKKDHPAEYPYFVYFQFGYHNKTYMTEAEVQDAVKFYHLSADGKGGYFRYGRQPITILSREENMKRAEDYQRGLDDAWECIRELERLLFDNKLKDVFGEDIDFHTVVTTKTPFECINEIKEYKEKLSIKVGDEVYIDDKGRKAVVTKVSNYDLYNILFYNGDTNCVDRDLIAKLGKHYPGIEMILKQMRSEI